jgi:predicted XRE-type DNA-binding protein
MKERITKSSGSVFIDLGFPSEEAAVLAMRADLMAKLRTLIDARGWTHHEASKRLGIAQSRVSDRVRGKWDKFSLDILVTLEHKFHHYVFIDSKARRIDALRNSIGREMPALVPRCEFVHGDANNWLQTWCAGQDWNVQRAVVR